MWGNFPVMSALFLCIFLFDNNIVSFCFYTGVTWLCVSFVITSVLCALFLSVVSGGLDSFLFLCSQSLYILLRCVFETASLITAFSLFVLKPSTVFQLLLATFCPLLWTCEHPPLWKPACSFSSAYTKVPLNLLAFVLRNFTCKQLLSGRVQKCYPNILFPAHAQPGLFVVENMSGTREQDTTLFQDILRQGTETVQRWAMGGSK